MNEQPRENQYKYPLLVVIANALLWTFVFGVIWISVIAFLVRVIGISPFGAIFGSLAFGFAASLALTLWHVYVGHDRSMLIKATREGNIEEVRDLVQKNAAAKASVRTKAMAIARNKGYEDVFNILLAFQSELSTLQYWDKREQNNAGYRVLGFMVGGLLVLIGLIVITVDYFVNDFKRTSEGISVLGIGLVPLVIGLGFTISGLVNHLIVLKIRRRKRNLKEQKTVQPLR